MKNLGLALLCVTLLLPTRLLADLTADLSPDELKEVKAGEMVVRERKVDGGIWPELTVYRVVKAPAQDVTDVLRDYPNAHSYIPNLVKAQVVDSPASNVKDVEYTVKLPLFSTVSYTVRNKYETQGKMLLVKWQMLENPLADETNGSLAVEPFGDDSLIRYQNYVKPKTRAAGVAKGLAVKEVKDTVAAISKEAERRANGS